MLRPIGPAPSVGRHRLAARLVEQAQDHHRDADGPDHQRHDLGAEIPAQRHGHQAGQHGQHEQREQLLGTKYRRPEASQHLGRAALSADVVDERPEQPDDGHGEQDGDDRPEHPGEAITLDRDEHVALDAVAQHEAEDERRPRPLELLHQPADEAEQQERKQVAPRARRLECADINDAQHGRQDQRVAQRGEPGELRAERVAQAGAQDVGERHRPHHRVGDAEILGQHVGAGYQAVDQEGAEEDGHGGAARDPERDGRHQGAALLGVVGALRRDDAAHVAAGPNVWAAPFSVLSAWP